MVSRQILKERQQDRYIDFCSYLRGRKIPKSYMERKSATTATLMFPSPHERPSHERPNREQAGGEVGDTTGGDSKRRDIQKVKSSPPEDALSRGVVVAWETGRENIGGQIWCFIYGASSRHQQSRHRAMLLSMARFQYIISSCQGCCKSKGTDNVQEALRLVANLQPVHTLPPPRSFLSITIICPKHIKRLESETTETVCCLSIPVSNPGEHHTTPTSITAKQTQPSDHSTKHTSTYYG